MPVTGIPAKPPKNLTFRNVCVRIRDSSRWNEPADNGAAREKRAAQKGELRSSARRDLGGNCRGEAIDKDLVCLKSSLDMRKTSGHGEAITQGNLQNSLSPHIGRSMKPRLIAYLTVPTDLHTSAGAVRPTTNRTSALRDSPCLSVRVRPAVCAASKFNG